jgi:hypothetical protein
VTPEHQLGRILSIEAWQQDLVDQVVERVLVGRKLLFSLGQRLVQLFCCFGNELVGGLRRRLRQHRNR